MFNNRFSQKFYSPEDTPTGKMGVEDIVDILNDDSDNGEKDEIQIEDSDKGAGKDKSDKKVGKEKEEDEKTEGQGDSDDELESKDEEEGDELDELEEELDEDEKDEDELELITPVKRKAILAKYPTIFKDFPYLEKAYYREQKYAEMFPSLDDAKSAMEDAQVLRTFETQILKGDLTDIVAELKKENVESFHKLVDNYLPTLQKVDEKAFFHVINSVVKPIIFKMVKDGTDNEDAELVAAARKLNQFFYGTAKWEPHQALSKGDLGKEEDGESKKISEERRQLFNERYTEARTKLGERVDSSFKKVIEKNIDPKGDMSDYVKKQASREAYETLSELLSKDTRFRSILDKAWRRAGEQNFNSESIERIRGIINSRAKTVLPSVIKKARNEALRGIGKRVRVEKTKKDDDSDIDDSGRSTSSRNRGPLKDSNKSSGGSKPTEIPKGMSNKDFIMSD